MKSWANLYTFPLPLPIMSKSGGQLEPANECLQYCSFIMDRQNWHNAFVLDRFSAEKIQTDFGLMQIRFIFTILAAPVSTPQVAIQLLNLDCTLIFNTVGSIGDSYFMES